MSYANGTTHYNLPQTVGTDKRDWFDTNAAFAAIDAALYAAATGQAADAEAIAAINGQITTIQGDITSLQGTVGGHTTQIEALQTSVFGLSNTVADVRQDGEDMITANNEGAAATSTRAYAIDDYFIYNDVLYKATAAIAIGDTIVPNTNCKATNVDTEIREIKSDLPRQTLLGEIVADGVKTRAQILAELTAAIDFTKLRIGVSVLDINGNYAYTFDQFIASNNTAYFGLGNNVIRQITLQKNGTPSDTYYILGTSTTPQDGSSDVPTVGTTFRVYA